MKLYPEGFGKISHGNGQGNVLEEEGTVLAWEQSHEGKMKCGAVQKWTVGTFAYLIKKIACHTYRYKRK